MKELTERLQAPTPVWFKRIITGGLCVAAAGAAILAAPSLVPDIIIPVVVKTAAQWMVVMGSVAAAVSKTAKAS